MYSSLTGTKKAIAHWLLLLKPGESMDLRPEAFGATVETLQQYVHGINGMEGRRYKCFGGLRKRRGKRLFRPEGSALRVQAVKQ